MPRLFALQGPGNCGKSETLIQLFQIIQTKYPNATVQTLHTGTKDIAVIIRRINGLVVGIESQGDPQSRLENSLTDFAEAKCDIIFCGCRTRGMTVDWVYALSSSYNICFITQTKVTNNYFATNEATAELLMQHAKI